MPRSWRRTPRPNASNLNFTAGQTIPNFVIVKVSAAGTICRYNNSGAVQAIIDVAGWFADGATPLSVG